MTTIGVGDTVRYQTADQSPFRARAMTVEALTSDGRAECVWFDAEGTLHRTVCSIDSLTVVEGEP